MILQILSVTIGLVAIAFLLLGINVLFKKKGKFPNFHIGGNKEMAKRGIYCATTNDKLERKSKSRFDFTKLQHEVDDSLSC
ncbi:hypothetical protein ACE01N_05685 [Saccharicrinis sp. FJH2]|uniref:hypothetical protein n=1 Tax=Saccharicrinis sp. FJH65 TaxID=3344659 RepID=UPI0035F25D1E